MYAVTVGLESIARGRLTLTGSRPGAERRSHQFRPELTAEGPSPEEYGSPIDTDRANEADELELRDPDATLDELPASEMHEDETAAAACAVER